MVDMLDQIQFAATLKLASHLHIGAGETERLSVLRPTAKLPDGVDPEVATVVRDHKCMPVIPVTGLKGPLRRAVIANCGKEQAGRLLGVIKQATGLGQAGTVWLQSVIWKQDIQEQPGDLPYWERDTQSWISTHVAIDRKSGAAAAQKLFNVEHVPPGATFTISGVAFGENAEADIEAVLAPLAAADGLALGADQRFGAGRIKLDGDVTLTRRWFNPTDGEIKLDAPRTVPMASVQANSTAAKIVDMALHCPGPYLTVDASEPESRSNENTLRAARRIEGTPRPILPETSLIGALRSRAAWLCHVNGIGSGEDRDRPTRRPDEWMDGSRQPHAGRLQPAERLFGVGGWKGFVRVISIDCDGGTLCDGKEGRAPPYASVSIDRFGQGPLDGALFSTEFFLEAKFKVRLALDARGTWPSPDDDKLWNCLIDDITSEGLMLGHGRNSGFGWFKVGVGGRSTSASARVAESAPAGSQAAKQSAKAVPSPARKHQHGTVKSGKPGKKKGKKR